MRISPLSCSAVCCRLLAALLLPPCLAAPLGGPCGGDAPLLSANDWPDLGTPGFVLQLSHATPSGIALLAGSTTQPSVPALGCVLHADPTEALILLSTDARGRADAPLPVPATASLLAAELFFQAAVLSPQTPSGLSLSAGLRTRIGR